MGAGNRNHPADVIGAAAAGKIVGRFSQALGNGAEGGGSTDPLGNLVTDIRRIEVGEDEHIRCPVLILRGTNSDFLTAPLLDQMRRRLPHAEVIEFEGAGHTRALNAAEQVDPVVKWLDAN